MQQIQMWFFSIFARKPISLVCSTKLKNFFSTIISYWIWSVHKIDIHARECLSSCQIPELKNIFIMWYVCRQQTCETFQNNDVLSERRCHGINAKFKINLKFIEMFLYLTWFGMCVMFIDFCARYNDFKARKGASILKVYCPHILFSELILINLL